MYIVDSDYVEFGYEFNMVFYTEDDDCSNQQSHEFIIILN